MANLTRRKFLTGAAVAGVGALSLGLAACAPSTGGGSNVSHPSAIPETWDEEHEIVVLGAGITGMAAAISAKLAGADVMVYDSASTAGGTSALSGGIVQAAGTKWQKQFTQYQDDTPAKHAECYIQQAEGLADPDLIKAITARAPEMVQWMADNGTEWIGLYGNCRVPNMDQQYVADRIHLNSKSSGTGITDPEFAKAQELGVPFTFGAKALNLYRDPSAGVVGVQIQQGNATSNVKASKAVVLALGGIDHNTVMAQALNPQQYWALTEHSCLCHPNNMGDGIRMGMAVGGALATHGGTIDIDFVAMLGLSNTTPTIPGIIVNQAGMRFVCEDATYAYIMRACWQEIRKLSGQTWLIMDQNMVEKNVGPFAADPDSHIKDGQFYKGETLAELGQKIGVPAGSLEASFKLWNDNIAATGTDPIFQRNTELIELGKGPFYANRCTTANLGSLGGLKINTKTQVIDNEGQVIPRLYAGGMNSGGWYGNYYPGSGTALMGGAVTGRIAAENAVLETPWV